MSIYLVQQLVKARTAFSCLYQSNKLPKVLGPLQNRKYSYSCIFSNRWESLKSITCAPKFYPYKNDFRGFKDKDVLTKRCKDCYFQRVDGRWYVFCNTHPRHKQRQKVDEKSKWIITHSTHGVKKF